MIKINFRKKIVKIFAKKEIDKYDIADALFIVFLISLTLFSSLSVLYMIKENADIIFIEGTIAFIIYTGSLFAWMICVTE